MCYDVYESVVEVSFDSCVLIEGMYVVLLSVARAVASAIRKAILRTADKARGGWVRGEHE